MPAADQLRLLGDIYAQAKATGSMESIEQLSREFSGRTNDGVVVLLTRILTELHAIEFQLATSELVTSLLMGHYRKNGGLWVEFDLNVLKQCTRRQVRDYLANKL